MTLLTQRPGDFEAELERKAIRARKLAAKDQVSFDKKRSRRADKINSLNQAMQQAAAERRAERRAENPKLKSLARQSRSTAPSDVQDVRRLCHARKHTKASG